MLQGRSLFLEDLCVKEEYRNCGIGTALMQECAKLAREEGCTNMTWQLMDWNAKAKQFYERIGADIKKGWLTMKLTEPGLGNLASGGSSTNKSA
ncbi:Thialysine N-epsilon-acetyltransferase [Geodia barretti]|nr:Thialysine N-epsilon-acetyltransferase [Geodia barretti]